MSAVIEVVGAGVLVLLQDRGRPGYAHLGVPRAGALDPAAAALANRLVGNPADAVVLEVVGGVSLRTDDGRWVGVSGAPCNVVVDGVARPHAQAAWLPAGARLTVGPALAGVRSYVAVGGGLAVAPVLGSGSTDTLAWVGPARVVAGTRLPVGAAGEPAAVDVVASPPITGAAELRLLPGPHREWFGAEAYDVLARGGWIVQPDSNRVGLRLRGDVPVPRTAGELPSEGTVLGAVQVPLDGQPVVLLNDHGTTGGYPVIGVVEPADLAACAQLRPGDRVTLRPARG